MKPFPLKHFSEFVFSRRFSVRLGEHTISTAKDCEIIEEPDTCTEVENVPIESVITHERYNSTKKFNDIALIRLSRDIKISKKKKNIKTICLPTLESQNVENVEAGLLTIAGWGHTENNTQSTNDVLIQALVPYLPHENCVARFQEEKKTHKLIKSIIYETQICAGGVERVDS